MIGLSHCTTTAEVARIIQPHPKIDIEDIIFDTPKSTTDVTRFADPTLASRELGWAPKADADRTA